MNINRANLDALFVNVRADYEAGALAVKPLKDRIAMTANSSTREETYGWLGNYNRLREWVGQKVVNNLVAHGFSIKNRTFENTISIPREDIEDDLVGVYSGAFKMLGQDAALHPDELVFELLKGGASQLCYDGKNFFATNHPVNPDDATAGTVSNVDLTSPGDAIGWALLDTTKVVKPFIFQKRKDYTFIRKDQDTDDNVFFSKEYIFGVEARANAGYGLWQLAYGSNKTLDSTSYAAARRAMMELKAPSGKPLGITPDLLLCAPEFEEAALELINGDRNTAGASNVWRGTAELIVCPWLA